MARGGLLAPAGALQHAHVGGDDTGAAIRAGNIGKERQREEPDGFLQRTPFGHGSASTGFARGCPLGNDLASPKMDRQGPPHRGAALLSRARAISCARAELKHNQWSVCLAVR